MMYTVWTFDEMALEDVMVFSGTFEACMAYVNGEADYYVVAPDGFSVVG